MGSGYVYLFDDSPWDILIYYSSTLVRLIEAWCIVTTEGLRNVRIGLREIVARVLFKGYGV